MPHGGTTDYVTPCGATTTTTAGTAPPHASATTTDADPPHGATNTDASPPHGATTTDAATPHGATTTTTAGAAPPCASATTTDADPPHGATSTTIVDAPSPQDLTVQQNYTEDISQTVNHLATLNQHWERLLFSTGGAINTRKSFWYLMAWTWKSGQPQLISTFNLPVKL